MMNNISKSIRLVLFVFVWCIRFCYFWQVDAKQYNTIGGLLMHIAAPVPGRVSSLYYDLTQSFVAIGTVGFILVLIPFKTCRNLGIFNIFWHIKQDVPHSSSYSGWFRASNKCNCLQYAIKIWIVSNKYLSWHFQSKQSWRINWLQNNVAYNKQPLNWSYFQYLSWRIINKIAVRTSLLDKQISVNPNTKSHLYIIIW